MGHRGCLVDLFICRKQFLATASIANEKFAVDKLVPRHFIAAEKAAQFFQVRRPVREEPDPYGSVRQDHYAALRPREGFSRRLGTSRASGSDPPKALSLS